MSKKAKCIYLDLKMLLLKTATDHLHLLSIAALLLVEGLDQRGATSVSAQAAEPSADGGADAHGVPGTVLTRLFRVQALLCRQQLGPGEG